MSPPPFTISRVPRSDHTGLVKELVERTGLFHPFEVEVAVELVEEAIEKGSASDYHFIFAEQPGKLVGYSCFGPIPLTLQSFDLYWIAVDPAFQGQGVGQALMRETEAGIVMSGGSRAYAETSGRDLYHRTNLFYQRQGYREEARLKDFYAPGDDKVIYTKVLKE